MDIREELNDIRIRKGISFQQLADEADMTEPATHRALRSDSGITLRTLEKLLNALDCELVIKEKNND